MSDEEDELLELIGESSAKRNHDREEGSDSSFTSDSGPKKSRKRRSRRDNDVDFEMEEGEEEDEELIDDEIDVGDEPSLASEAYKKSAAYMEVMSFGDDLMGDGSDRERLLSLPEIEREAILAERADKKMQVLERLEVMKKLEIQELERERTAKRRTGVSKQSIKRSKALQKLKQDKSRRVSDKAKRHLSDEEIEDGSLEDDSGSAGFDSDAESDDSLKWDRRDAKGARGIRSREDYEAYMAKLPAVEAVQKATLTRADLAKYCFLPDIESRLKDCFVKLKVYDKQLKHDTYQLRLVKGLVSTKRPYRLDDKTLVQDGLLLYHCDQDRNPVEFPMFAVSGSPVTAQDYETYVSHCRAESWYPPDSDQVVEAGEKVAALRAHAVNDEEVEFMVKRKREIASVLGRPTDTHGSLVDKQVELLTKLETEEDGVARQVLLDSLVKVEEKIKTSTTVPGFGQKQSMASLIKGEYSGLKRPETKNQYVFSPSAILPSIVLPQSNPTSPVNLGGLPLQNTKECTRYEAFFRKLDLGSLPEQPEALQKFLKSSS